MPLITKMATKTGTPLGPLPAHAPAFVRRLVNYTSAWDPQLSLPETPSSHKGPLLQRSAINIGNVCASAFMHLLSLPAFDH